MQDEASAQRGGILNPKYQVTSASSAQAPREREGLFIHLPRQRGFGARGGFPRLSAAFQTNCFLYLFIFLLLWLLLSFGRSNYCLVEVLSLSLSPPLPRSAQKNPNTLWL